MRSQGDILSPTLFTIYINDLALEIKKANSGVHLNGNIMGILLYAPDIALQAESDRNLQNMLTIVNVWCYKWRLAIHQGKTQIIHFREKPGKGVYNFIF